MRRYNLKHIHRFSTVLAASASFGLVACGDDSTPAPTTDTSTGNDTSAEPDTSTGDDTTAGDDTATGTDTTPVDPCDPNPCTTPPGPRCDENTVVTSTGTGTCTANGSAAQCAYDEAETECTGDTPICAGGTCVAAGDSCDYDFGERVSYVSEIKIVSPDNCCFDFDDDGENDNKLGELLDPNGPLGGIIAQQGFDINATLAEQICFDAAAECTEAGLVLLLETLGVTDATAGTGITVNGFYGSDTDADLANNRAGNGVYSVQKASFIEGTAAPVISFANAEIAAGVLSAGPSLFTLNIPLLGANLSLAVEQTRFEGAVSIGANGQGLAMGGTEGAALGGTVQIQAVADAFNNFLNASCTCVAKTDPAKPYVGINTVNNAQRVSLNIKDGDACTGEDQTTCKAIGDNLKSTSVIALALPGALSPDIDVDFDGTRDSISIGVRIKATTGTISGVDMCEVR